MIKKVIRETAVITISYYFFGILIYQVTVPSHIAYSPNFQRF